MTLDLAAERAASRARQDERMVEARARMLLSGRWDMTRFEIMGAIAERYPAMTEADADSLASVALEIRTAERRRITQTQPVPEPMEAEVPTTAISPERRIRIFDRTKELLDEDHTRTADYVIAYITDELGGEIDRQWFYAEIYRYVRKELGITGAGESAKRTTEKAETPAPPPMPPPQSRSENRKSPNENGNGAHPPVNRVAAGDVAFSDAVHEASPGPVLQQAVREEVRSLRATYEAGQYVRVEQEDDTWCLRVMLDFPTQAEAMRALAKLLG